jgi:hypothetical protein
VSDDAPNLGKRSLLATVGLAAAAVGLAALVSRATPAPTAPHAPSTPDRPPDPEVLALLGEEITTARRMDGLRVTRIAGVVDGAIRVEMETSAGEAFRIEILRRDPAGPAGVAETASLSFYLVGSAGSRTPEEVAQAIQSLARRVAAEEARGAKVPAALRSMRERGMDRR